MVYGTFAKSEDDYDKDRGCKDVLKVVKYKELFDNLGDDDRSTLHKYAREKSDSLRLSLKRRTRGLIVSGVRLHLLNVDVPDCRYTVQQCSSTGYSGIYWDILGYIAAYVLSEGFASDGRKASRRSTNQNVAGWMPRLKYPCQSGLVSA